MSFEKNPRCHIYRSFDEIKDVFEKRIWRTASGIFHETTLNRYVVFQLQPGGTANLSFGVPADIHDVRDHGIPEINGLILCSSPLFVVVGKKTILFDDCTYLHPTLSVNANSESMDWYGDQIYIEHIRSNIFD